MHPEQMQAFAPFFMMMPIVFFSLPIGLIAFLLARQKGRNEIAWTVLGLIPFINTIALVYFVGSTNLRLEQKIDQLLAENASTPLTPETTN